MSIEFNIIGISLESIKDDNLNLLDRSLRIMPLEKLEDKHEVLLSTFLATCAQYNREEAAKMILERWKVIYPDGEKISIFARLFLKLIINLPTLSFLVTTHKDITFVELIDELSEWDNSEDVVSACGRADQLYGNQSYETYQILLKHAIEFGNYRVEEFLIGKISEVAPYVSKPVYVKNYLEKYYPQYKDNLPTSKELDNLAEIEEKDEKDDEIILPDDDEAVRLMTEGLETAGISILEIEEAKIFLKKEISSSLERKKELLLPILKNLIQLNLETDRILFWIYGSSNPLVNQDLTLNTPSAKYGGCRMFLTDLFDYDEDEGYFEDWFIGYCQKCLLRIKHRHYAVRQPRPHGGWEGCFCSFKCVREFVNDIEAEESKPDILTHELITLFEKKINENGIQDRLIA